MRLILLAPLHRIARVAAVVIVALIPSLAAAMSISPHLATSQALAALPRAETGPLRAPNSAGAPITGVSARMDSATASPSDSALATSGSSTAAPTGTDAGVATSTAALETPTTPADSATATPTATDLATATVSPSPAPTYTQTPVSTPTATPLATGTATLTPSRTRTFTRTATPTRTPTCTRTNTRTRTPTATRTVTRTPSTTATRTPTRTVVPTRTSVAHVAARATTAPTARAAAGLGTPLPAATLVFHASTTVDHRFGVVDSWRSPRDAAQIGVGWQRLTLFWKSFQPHGPDEWNYFATAHDSYINAALVSGQQLVGELISTPDWAAANPSQHGMSAPKGLYLPYDDPKNYWGHFVGLIAKRYAGRIDQWVIWNEVTIPSGTYATWKGTVQDYAQLVKVAYLAARAVNPKAQIVLYGDPYWYDRGAFFNKLLKLLTSAPGAAAHHDYFDVVNLHLYSRASDYVTVVGLYRQWLKTYGLDKPIWIGETNAVPCDDPVRLYPRSSLFTTLDGQASYIVEVFALSLVLNVERIEVNRMIDGTEFTNGGEPLGLMRNDRSRRPAYQAFAAVSSLFKGVTGGTLTVDPRTGLYTVRLTKPHQTVTVMWNQGSHPIIMSAQASLGTVEFNKLGLVLHLEPRNGVVMFALAPATGSTGLSVAKQPVIGGNPIIFVRPQP